MHKAVLITILKEAVRTKLHSVKLVDNNLLHYPGPIFGIVISLECLDVIGVLNYCAIE